MRAGLRINQINPGWVLADHEYRTKVVEGLSADWPTQIPRGFAPSGQSDTRRRVGPFAVQFLSAQRRNW